MVGAAAGCTLFALYVVTLSRGLYPGDSAAWVAAATGVEPWPDATRPLWRVWVAAWGHLPLGEQVWWLNLSSAVAVAATAGLLCGHVASWVHSRFEVDTPVAQQRVVLVSALSGLVTAIVFGVSLAGWSAATRLNPFAFDVLLVACAFALYHGYVARHGLWRVYVLALLGGSGVIETAMFLLLAPYFVIATLVALYLRHRLKWALVCRLAAVGLCGAVCCTAAAWFLSARAPGTSWMGLLRQVVQIGDLRAYLPDMGWLWLLLILVLPWVTLQAGAWPRLSDPRTPAVSFLHVALTLAVLALLVNISIPPWPAWAAVGRLPVLEMMLAAMLGGWVCAYWLRGLLVPWPAPVEDDVGRGAAQRREEARRVETAVSLVMSGAFAAVLLFAVMRNGRLADGRRGAFADRCASDVLDQLGERTWLATDGALDRHLCRLAAARGKVLRLVNLAQDRRPAQLAQLRALIDADPQLQVYRTRLANAATVGGSVFVKEWLAVDPAAGRLLALYGAPDVWRAAGWQAVPDRFLFIGTREVDGLAQVPPFAEAQAFWTRMDQTLPYGKGERDRDPIDRLARALRRHLSLVANDCGVLLEDVRRPQEAHEAYRQALRLDPDNTSALLNRMMLARQGVLTPEEKETAEREAEAGLAAIKRRPSFLALVQLHGQVRAPEALAGLGTGWMQIGQTDLARSALTRAADVTPDGQHRDAFLGVLASFSLTTGDFVRGEELFRRMLDRQPADPRALTGLLRLSLLRRDAAAARTWLARARVAGLPAPACALEEAAIELAEHNADAACTRLLALTDSDPGNLQAFALLATAMVEQGRADEAAAAVLPRMIKAAGRAGNPLVFQVQGVVEAGRRPPAYAAARQAFRCAVAMQPGRQDLLARILSLDLVLTDLAAAERDARELVRLDSDNGLAHFVLGSQAAARGETTDAEWHLRCSVASDGSATAWNNLADVLRQRGALEDAEGAARQALGMATNSVAVLDTLACVLLDRNKTTEAGEVIAHARALAPQDWQVSLTEARVLWQSGQHEKARALLRDVRDHQDALPPEARAAVATLLAGWTARP